MQLNIYLICRPNNSQMGKNTVANNYFKKAKPNQTTVHSNHLFQHTHKSEKSKRNSKTHLHIVYRITFRIRADVIKPHGFS